MADWKKSYWWGTGGDTLPEDEFLAAELNRRAEYDKRPDVIDRKKRNAVDRERAERERVGKDGKPSLIGPPNPYKANRKLGPEDRGVD
jgi:hypothetical protein